MSFLAGRDNPGHLAEAMAHYNRAKDLTESGGPSVEVARALSDALNKIQTEWLVNQPKQELGEVNGFQSMALNEVKPEARLGVLNSPELRNVVHLAPQIMNHDTLRRHQYRSGAGINPSLQRRASEEHRKLVTAYREVQTCGSEELKERVLRRTAELLYIVRSIIAHGEKTPYGPDLEKAERDRRVCETVVPLQLKLVDLLLDLPCQQLVVYGTLAPGRANHDLIADIAGSWQGCEVRGSIDSLVGGLPVLSWKPSGQDVSSVSLLASAELPNHWERIDKFEGEAYKRRLIPVRTGTGIAIANVYLAAASRREKH